MKTIVNKEINLELVELRQSTDTNSFVEVGTKKTTSYADLLVQLAKQPTAKGDVGDLEEQMLRMKIIDKAKKAKKGKPIELEDAEAKVLQANLGNFKLILLDTGLIEFQKQIKEL